MGAGARLKNVLAGAQKMSSELRSGEVQIRDLEGQLEQQKAVLREKEAEASELKQVEFHFLHVLTLLCFACLLLRGSNL